MATNTFNVAGDLSVGGNWSLGHVPTLSEDVSIEADATWTGGYEVTCKTFTVIENVTIHKTYFQPFGELTITTGGGRPEFRGGNL